MAPKKQAHTFDERPTSRQGIERQIGRILSLRTTTPLARLRSRINQQTTSPFFKLSAELRNVIYNIVFAEYAASQEYLPTAKRKRSGYQGPRKTDCAMLQTCRKVWFEVYHLPTSLPTPTFWLWNSPHGLARMELSYAAYEDKDTDRATI
jgi:hypothetical protein